ncbi:hypothetical protein ACJ72_03873 [Emergomyces africanus]|uniref:C2H2-type domain-containing protein n=1 Tax=Emergomyces africanus TaxID=1955775 RepID=A0A1B7NYD2_9EURO|nr:hypothetical protein ACJ72_03873 [Emergomyces africanus]
MNLSHLVTSYQNSPSSTYSYSGTSQKRQALHSEPSSLSVSNGYYDRNASNLAYSRTPQPPLSPPVEEQTRFSLPSISTLLQGADHLSPVHIAKKHRPNSLSPIDVDLKSQGHGASQRPMNRPRMILPPTPPLRPGSGLDGSNHSPSGSSPSSAHSPISVANLTNSTISSTESYQRRTSQAPFPPQSTRTSVSHGSPVSITEKHYTASSKLPPSAAPFASPVEPPANSTEYYLRPSHAPPSFSPSIPLTAAPSAQQHHHHSIISTWQHHHYFPPSNTAPYPQNHDRYICRTCHKAFSRPSSLRIHSHSHTGEKPFKCPHVNCGKSFSVRSNMKRHERGCHTGKPTQTALVN